MGRAGAPGRVRPAPAGWARPMWQALFVLRLALLAYAATVIAYRHQDLARPGAAVAVLTFMAGWTVAVSLIYREASAARAGWAVADLAVAAGALLLTGYVDRPGGLLAHGFTLPGPWPAGAVLACAVLGGPWRGIAASTAVVAATLVLPGDSHDADTFDMLLMLVVAAGATGLVARWLDRDERRMVRLVEREATRHERDRLARSIHDGVLQLLALVQWRGADLGPDGAELARLAAVQESSLRLLMTRDGEPAGAATDLDLCAALAGLAGPGVHLALPIDAVRLPAGVATEVLAAVGAAIDNAHRHAGPRPGIYLVLDADSTEITISVRDDGPGIPAGRLTQAAGEGRLGVVQSICGRMRDLGGTATITSSPREGTEVEFRLPRTPSPHLAAGA